MYVQQNESYFWGNLIPACSLILAIMIFLVGRQSYCRRPPAGSVLASTLSIVKEAIKKSRRPSPSSLFVDHWLDRAKQCYGGTYSNWEVEDVKKVYRLLPIFGTFILYWTVYAQVSVKDIVPFFRKPSCHPFSFSYLILAFLPPLVLTLFFPALSSFFYPHFLPVPATLAFSTLSLSSLLRLSLSPSLSFFLPPTLCPIYSLPFSLPPCHPLSLTSILFTTPSFLILFISPPPLESLSYPLLSASLPLSFQPNLFSLDEYINDIPR